MQYTPKFKEILDKCEAMGDAGYSLGEIQEFFRESVGGLDPAERLNNLYRIRPKKPVPGETSRLAQFKMNKMQIEYFKNRTNRDLILKMRQGGVTTFSCLIALDMALWNDGVNTAIMAHVRDNVKAIFKIVKTAFVCFQKDWGQLYPVSTKYDSTTELVIAETGSSLRVCTETKGLTLDFLHISEACFVEDSRISESIESVPLSGKVVMESTPDKAAGMFFDIWSLWLSGEAVSYKGHFFPWWWHYPEESDFQHLRPDENFKLTEKEEMLVKQHGLSPEHVVWRRMKIAECGGDEGEFMRKYPEDPQTCFLCGSSSFFPLSILTALWKNKRAPAFMGDLLAA